MNQARRELIGKLTNLISKGEIVKGGKLPPERELAALVATSRPLLREALISLEALGYLDIRDRQGIYLAGDDSSEALEALGQAQVWPMEMLSQVMEVRQILDPGATALAAMRRNDRDMAKLEECLAMLERIHAEQGPDEASLGAYWNTVLHSTIFKATRNTLLARLYETLLGMSERGVIAMRSNALNSSTRLANKKVLRQHRSLVVAIRERDMEKAREASRVHLKDTIETMVKLSRVTPVSNFFAQRMDPVLK